MESYSFVSVQLLAFSMSRNVHGPGGEVGAFTRLGLICNTVNPAITSVNTNSVVDVADGIFWGQDGGNWFVARNAITNYGLEGIQFNGGPAAAVGNTYKTYVSLGSTVALNDAPSKPSVSGTTTDPQDHSMYFVGNSVDGGRSGSSPGVLGDFRHHLHFTGNSISLLPAFQRSEDSPSTAAWGRILVFANISGNTLLTGERGFVWLDNCTNTLLLKNDFGVATNRALDHQGVSGSVHHSQILKNVLNQGTSYHLKLTYPDSTAFFLQKNVYTNGITTVDPFFDAAGSPIHMMR